jgi:NADH-quinone oxidoreductase subunit L
MEHLFAFQHAWLIPLLPLIGACIAGLFGARHLKEDSHWPIWIGVGISALLALSLLFGMARQSAPIAAESKEGSTFMGGPARPLVIKDEHVEPAVPIAPDKTAAAPAPRPRDYPLAKSVEVFTWLQAGDPNNEGTPLQPQVVYGNPTASLHVAAGFFIDPLTAIMLCVICCIGFLITVFAKGYMHGESGYFRFFAYLGLFIFAMTILVMGDNLLMLYLGWEGVGLCSYLLIGYYFEKPSAREAAKKAFLVNRIGDFGFGLGIMLSFLAFGTISYFGQGVGTHTGLLELAMSNDNFTGFQTWAAHAIPFLLMLGAFGKSAQFPLYVWLPDAMEGPTPVSALIHAATMVTAGVYMIARCGTLFVGTPAAMDTIAAIGCFTAVLAAVIALRQFDLKKVFAYSTISQLGFMFTAVGCLAPVAGVFHLVTHAFFKALLFLSSGVVMHAMAGELDMRKMSGIKRVLPITNILMLIGCCALAGFPFFSGFFSKDEIVGAAFSRSWLLGAILLFTAFLTAYYTFRLYFQVFQGPLVIPAAPAAPEPDHGHGHDAHDDAAHGHDDHHHNHEPRIMILPLVILAIGAALGGWFNRGDALAHFLGQSPSFALASDILQQQDLAGGLPYFSAANFGLVERGAAEHSELGLMILSGCISIIGISLAWLLHLRRRATAERIAAGLQPLTGLIEKKFLVDELYQSAIVDPLRMLGRILFAIDRTLVDGLVRVIGYIPQVFGFLLSQTLQRGYLQGYAAAMLLGIAVILILIFMR